MHLAFVIRINYLENSNISTIKSHFENRISWAQPKRVWHLRIQYHTSPNGFKKYHKRAQAYLINFQSLSNSSPVPKVMQSTQNDNSSLPWRPNTSTKKFFDNNPFWGHFDNKIKKYFICEICKRLPIPPSYYNKNLLVIRSHLQAQNSKKNHSGSN